MATSPALKRHFLLRDEFRQAHDYKSKSSGQSKPVPAQNRSAHGGQLKAELSQIETAYAMMQKELPSAEHIREKGLIIEIVTLAEFAQKTEIFDRADHLQLLNHRPGMDEGGHAIVRQTWFVPDGQLSYLAGILDDYLKKDTRFNKPQRQSLVDSIQSLKTAALEQLWTEPEPLPLPEVRVWWEVWLRAGESEVDREGIWTQFKNEAALVGLNVGENKVKLPEHTIVAVLGSRTQFELSLPLLNCLTELRKVRDFAGHFDNLPVDEQWEWAKAVRPQLEPEPERGDERRDARVALCVMDTGVNRGHPLLEIRLPESRNLTIKEHWTASDNYGGTGHGTPMTGLCLYGNLTSVLGVNDPVSAPFVLEAVKIVPPESEGNDEEKLAAAFTEMGAHTIESLGPHRKRVWCISTSLDEPEIIGVPGSWSAVLDSLAAGMESVTAPKRLFCLAGGNLKSEYSGHYPQGNFDHSCHTPAQAWNALVVGSCTFLDQIRTSRTSETILARHGGMAPSNTTSCVWDTKWPNKPDVVFEGGNAVGGANGGSPLVDTDLSLLSTAADFNTSPFCGMTGTSPATALAARMAAMIQAAYPSFWPETVRGLIVHSARWTPVMETMAGRGNKQALSKLLRMVGYGYPRMDVALECAQARATLIVQSEIQPFKCTGPPSAKPGFNELHLHSLPWPAAELEKYGAETVRMRVTLSYFIEPNPGNRGYGTNYRYASCGLRFRVSSPGQDASDLLAMVDKDTSDLLDGLTTKGNLNGWRLDQDLVHKGSVHSNIWEGSAADLADMRHIAVYPVTGWWKTRKALKRYNAKVRYSLIVTLESDNPNLDVYTEIENAIAQTIKTAVEVDV